jgi:hypothetical protein
MLNILAMFGEKTAAENGDGILAEIKIQEVLFVASIRRDQNFRRD